VHYLFLSFFLGWRTPNLITGSSLGWLHRLCRSTVQVCSASQMMVLRKMFWVLGSQGRVCPSIDVVCKVDKTALKNSSVFVRRSTFRVSFHRFMQKSPRNRSIPPKLQPIADRMAKILEIICENFQFSTGRTRILIQMQYTATRCNMLQRAATCCNTHLHVDGTPNNRYVFLT